MGIGGGCALVVYSKFVRFCSTRKKISSFREQRKAFSIIEREAAPLYADRKIYLQKENLSLIGKFFSLMKNVLNSNLSGPLSIATPGELLAYHEAYHRFGGGVPWSKLFAPAIHLCEKGFNVSRTLAHAIKKNEKFILNDTQLRLAIY